MHWILDPHLLTHSNLSKRMESVHILWIVCQQPHGFCCSLAVKIQCVLINIVSHNIDVLKCNMCQIKDVCLSVGAKLLPQENQPWRQLDSHGGCWGLEQQNTAGNKEAWQLHAC